DRREAGDEQEEDTADSIFLALGGLFRDTSLGVEQEGEDGGNPIEYSPPTASPTPSPFLPLPAPPASPGVNPDAPESTESEGAQ
ncbi:unnamed protein product, partial [Laminaria digitata]